MHDSPLSRFVHIRPHSTALIVLALLSLFGSQAASGQDTSRYYRVYLRDKGTPERVLQRSDPWYDRAAEHLSDRAMRRRGKVLPPDSLVTTRDLPLFEPYVDSIAATGAVIAQQSRWFNTVMIIADSAIYQRVRSLQCVDSSMVMGAVRERFVRPFERPSTTPSLSTTDVGEADTHGGCIVGRYGLSDYQNRIMGIDAAHRIGIAGSGVLVGITDAGFDWRSAGLFDLGSRVLAEYDFVNHDSIVYDEPSEQGLRAQEHGTNVASIIGARRPDTLVGGAPFATFVLAKTEDIRSERHVEEDNFVAALEWMEALGVDVTNTSLGYTTFDAPEKAFDYSELDGHTAFASRGINYATHLGMVCVVAAGNDNFSYRYVGVPAEADSAIAAAAVDSLGRVASFSSRGPGSRRPVKPDVDGFGVGNWAASADDFRQFATGQGTSFASPMVASTVALLLSAAPELRPWEVRSLLTSTASQATHPDTALGYGLVRVDSLLEALSFLRPVVGAPVVQLGATSLAVAAFVAHDAASLDDALPGGSSDLESAVELEVRDLTSGALRTSSVRQPRVGIARWVLPREAADGVVRPADSLDITFRSLADGRLLRHTSVSLAPNASNGMIGLQPNDQSTLCYALAVPDESVTGATPNPLSDRTLIDFTVEHAADVTLEVFNSRGQRVAVLVDNDYRIPGHYYEYFDASGLPAGAYYYHLIVGAAIHTGAVVVVR